MMTIKPSTLKLYIGVCCCKKRHTLMSVFQNLEHTKNQRKLSENEIQDLWKEFLIDKTNKKNREALIMQYLPLVKYIVGRMRVNLPSTILTEDIAGYGVEGLISAIDRYSNDKNTKFETYAITRIRGTIIDKIRSQDWIPRGIRKRFKDIQQTSQLLQEKLGRQPSNQEIADQMELPLEKVEEAIAEMSKNSLMSLYDKKGSSEDGVEIIDTIKDDRKAEPLEKLEEQDVKKELQQALLRLPEREKVILTLYYHNNMTLKEIGEAIDVSESRVCQLHAQAIVKLKNLLNSNSQRLKRSII